MTAQIHKSKIDPDFKLAVDLYAKARNEQKPGDPRPSASAIVEAAVSRLPGKRLSDAEAMAVVERHVAENALPAAMNALRQLRGNVPQPARRTVGIWIRPKAKVAADARKARHEAAVAALEAAVEELKAGKVPALFAHLMPRQAPVIHDGADQFVADYETVDD